MDFKELIEDNEMADLIPNIANELRDTPEETLACMGLAIHQVKKDLFCLDSVKILKEDFTITIHFLQDTIHSVYNSLSKYNIYFI